MKKFVIFVLLILCFSSCVSMNRMMLGFTGETDKEIMAEAFPILLKGSDALLEGNPKKLKNAVLSASLSIMYANVFLQHEAELLPVTENEKKHHQLDRAKMYYLRGRDKIMSAYNSKYKNFTAALLSGDESQWSPFLAKMKKSDVDALYWMCSGWLGAFSLNPLDSAMISTVPAAIAFLQKAADLNPDYNDGAIWDVLTSIYAAAPMELGGDREKAVKCFNETMRCTGGKSISPYLTYITAFCIPENDSKNFDKYIELALSINPDEKPETRFQTTISREKVQYLKDHKDDYIIDWGD